MEQVTVLAARAEREAAGRPVVDKRMTAEDAAALIRDGDHVAIGGTLYSRTPMALVFALLRQRRRHLTVSRPLACYEIELFLATGALDKIVTSWVGIGLPWGLAPVFRHYVERGEARYDEWSHLAMGLRYKAGAMGVHFLNTGLIGPTLDPTKPQVLIYEPNGDKLQLVGAEWFTPVMPGIKEAPKVFGKALEGPMEGHAPIMPNGMHHWDLHVWLWKNNPNGMFSPTNPDVKCPKMGYSYVGDPPKMVMPDGLPTSSK